MAGVTNSILSGGEISHVKRQEWAIHLVFLMFIIPAVLLLIMTFVTPLGVFFQQAIFDPQFTLEHFEKAFSKNIYATIFLRTLKISFFTATICVLIGYPVAYVMAHSSGRLRMFILALVLIPFWTNVLARMFAWMAILGKEGVINETLLSFGLIGEPLAMMFSEFAVLVGMVHFMLPYMILPLLAVMVGIPSNLVDAGNSLGASPWQAFVRIYFPLSMPGVAAGYLLVFVISLGFFVTPALLGGSQDVLLAQVIEFQISEVLNWGFAAALSIILLVITIALYYFYTRFAEADGIH